MAQASRQRAASTPRGDMDPTEVRVRTGARHAEKEGRKDPDTGDARADSGSGHPCGAPHGRETDGTPSELDTAGTPPPRSAGHTERPVVAAHPSGRATTRTRIPASAWRGPFLHARRRSPRLGTSGHEPARRKVSTVRVLPIHAGRSSPDVRRAATACEASVSRTTAAPHVATPFGVPRTERATSVGRRRGDSLQDGNPRRASGSARRQRRDGATDSPAEQGLEVEPSLVDGERQGGKNSR